MSRMAVNWRKSKTKTKMTFAPTLLIGNPFSFHSFGKTFQTKTGMYTLFELYLPTFCAFPLVPRYFFDRLLVDFS